MQGKFCFAVLIFLLLRFDCARGNRQRNKKTSCHNASLMIFRPEACIYPAYLHFYGLFAGDRADHLQDWQGMLESRCTPPPSNQKPHSERL